VRETDRGTWRDRLRRGVKKNDRDKERHTKERDVEIERNERRDRER
jgi:hypothetical protein